MSQLADSMAGLRAELRSKPLLRLGFWAIAFLLLIYMLLVQTDRLDAAFETYQLNSERLQRSQQIREQADWSELLAQERSVKDKLLGALWQADTVGIAQAKLQGALETLVEGFAVRNLRIRSGDMQPVDGLKGVWHLQGQLTGRLSDREFVQLVERMAKDPKYMAVERLEYAANTSRITLIVSVFFQGLQGATP